MRRSSLLALTVVGALICLIGGSGLFAALTDTARSGTNSVDSAALAASADIQIAPASIPGATPPNYACGTFSEDRATGFFAASNVGPGYSTGFPPAFCVKNVGSQPVTLSALTIDLNDFEVTCSGDEAAFDETCEDGAAGELSGVLTITYRIYGNCATGIGGGGQETYVLSDNDTTPAALGSLAVGQTLCYTVGIAYPSTTPAEAVQRAQSDRATWRITFTAQS